MAERQALIDVFLAAAGWGGATRSPLAGDASFRRYLRLSEGSRRAVLMDAPPPHEDVRPFVAMSRHLRALGLSAPEVLVADPEAGLLLLEDLGENTYTRVLDKGAPGGGNEEDLYRLAVDVLIDLHRRPAAEAVPAGLGAHDEALLVEGAMLMVEWYLPAVLDAAPDGDARAAFAAAWRQVLPGALGQPATLVLRDYHVDNLVWLAERPGLAACGLLDFQDAVAGPAAYDLVSLLEDARRDLAPGLAAAMIDRYLAARPDLDRVAFARAYAILAAQRHSRVIGVFTRLARRDGKPGYLIHIARLWRLLEGALAHPGLAPVAAWYQRHVPLDKREIPPCPAAAQ